MPEEPTEPGTSQQFYTDENGNFHYFSQSSHTFTGNEQDFQNFAHLFDGPLSSVFSQISSTINASNSTTQPHYWARWDYTPEEWQRFDRFDFTRATIHMLIFAAISLFIYLLAVALFLSAALYAPDDSNTFLFVFIPLMLLLLFLPLLFHIVRHYVPRVRRHRARVQQDIRRVTIGPISLGDQAIWEAGQYIPLQSLFFKLKRVQFKEQPVPRLHFRRRHLEIRQSSWSDSIEIPVPTGHENEAQALVQRFHQETINGRGIFTPAEPI
jgi:hypothetical protein